MCLLRRWKQLHLRLHYVQRRRNNHFAQGRTHLPGGRPRPAPQRLNCSDDGSSGDKSLGSCRPSPSLSVDNEPAAIQSMTVERGEGETRTNFYVCVLAVLPPSLSPLDRPTAFVFPTEQTIIEEDEPLLSVYRRSRRRREPQWGARFWGLGLGGMALRRRQPSRRGTRSLFKDCMSSQFFTASPPDEMSDLFLCLAGPIRDDRRCSYLDRHSRSDSEAPRRRFHVLRVRAALGRQALLILLLLFFFLSAFIAFSRCRDEQTEQRKKSKSPHDDFQWRLSSARMRRNNQAEEKPNIEHTF